MNKKAQIEIYDTTLRDGAQAEGVNFSVTDKLRIAERLDQFGVHYIEGGWPGANPKDAEFFQVASGRQWRHAKIAAFCMTRKKGVRVEDDPQMRQLLEAQTSVVTIVGKTWLLHVTEVLRAKPDENLGMIADTIRFLKDQGKTVFYDAEHSFDGYTDEPEYALATWQAAERAGADAVVLCDTNGGRLPGEVARIVAVARKNLQCQIGIHTHNDAGFALANAVAAIEAGATQVQGTINGYGERTGNCDLISVMPVVSLKLGSRGVPKRSLRRLRDLSLFVDEVANFRHNPRLPWVGDSAFAHKGGMHVHAIDRVARSYEHVPPELVGNSRRVLVSEMAGRTNVLMKARELGFTLVPDASETRVITDRVKELEGQGYEYEAAEGSLALIIQLALKSDHQPPFVIESYHVSTRSNGTGSVCEATVKVRVGGKVYHAVAEGGGPVNALDKALREALNGTFGRLRGVKLRDYKVRILDGQPGTAAKTRVLITSTDGKREWGTVGVNENIITASLQALVDSMEYALLKIGE